jgi:hypothetical protein
MGRPIGSVNRQKPFNDALLMTLRSNPLALRRMAAKLVEKAEGGDLAAIREGCRSAGWKARADD